MRVEAHGKLIEGLRLAHGWLDELLRDPDASTRSIAEREGRSERSERMLLSRRLCRSGYHHGRSRAAPAARLWNERLTDLPPQWTEQRKSLGLPPIGPL
jgi:hypothetical protein